MQDFLLRRTSALALSVVENRARALQFLFRSGPYADDVSSSSDDYWSSSDDVNLSDDATTERSLVGLFNFGGQTCYRNSMFHSGDSPRSGHYYVTGRVSPNNTNGWYKFNDKMVTPIHFNKTVSNTAYMLFYRRIDTR